MQLRSSALSLILTLCVITQLPHRGLAAESPTGPGCPEIIVGLTDDWSISLKDIPPNGLAQVSVRLTNQEVLTDDGPSPYEAPLAAKLETVGFRLLKTGDLKRLRMSENPQDLVWSLALTLRRDAAEEGPAETVAASTERRGATRPLREKLDRMDDDDSLTVFIDVIFPQVAQGIKTTPAFTFSRKASRLLEEFQPVGEGTELRQIYKIRGTKTQLLQVLSWPEVDWMGKSAPKRRAPKPADGEGSVSP